MDGHDWSGTYWVTDVWRKSRCGATGGWSSGSCRGPTSAPTWRRRSARCSCGGESRVSAQALRKRGRSNFPPRPSLLSSPFCEGDDMGWMIGRTAAMADPAAARAKALAKLRTLAELDDPESLVVPVLIDALLMVESLSRGAAPVHLPARADRQHRRAAARADDRREGAAMGGRVKRSRLRNRAAPASLGR